MYNFFNRVLVLFFSYSRDKQMPGCLSFLNWQSLNRRTARHNRRLVQLEDIETLAFCGPALHSSCLVSLHWRYMLPSTKMPAVLFLILCMNMQKTDFKSLGASTAISDACSGVTFYLYSFSFFFFFSTCPSDKKSTFPITYSANMYLWKPEEQGTQAP